MKSLQDIINEQYDNDVVSIKQLDKISRGNTHHDKTNRAYYDKLKTDIEVNGILDPIVLLYVYETNSLSIKEGHHRLKIAKELGLKEVPVKIMVQWEGTGSSKYVTKNVGYKSKQLDKTPYDQRNYYPTYITPKEIGL